MNPSPNLLVVAVPEIPGITTGRVGSLSREKQRAKEEKKINARRPNRGRRMLMVLPYPISQGGHDVAPVTTMIKTSNPVISSRCSNRKADRPAVHRAYVKSPHHRAHPGFLCGSTCATPPGSGIVSGSPVSQLHESLQRRQEPLHGHPDGIRCGSFRNAPFIRFSADRADSFKRTPDCRGLLV